MRKLLLTIGVLTVLSVTSCRPAATPVALPTPTVLRPVVGTAVPSVSGTLSSSPQSIATAVPTVVIPTAMSVPPATADMNKTGSSGIHLTATIGPTCPGPQRIGQVCTQPYEGPFIVSNDNGAEVARATTNQDGQALIDLPPGVYTITPKIDGVLPSGKPLTVTVLVGQYVEANIELDSGIR